MVHPYGMWKINLNQITAMKKYFSILALGLASFAILSCNKELAPDTDPIDGGETVKVPMTFTAATEDSKANISGSSFLWNDGDAIAVFDGTSQNQFDIAPGSEGKKTASFSGTAAEAANYSAVAPYEVVNNYKPAESWIGVKIPGTQTVQLGRNVASGALVSTADDSGTGIFSFQNQFAVVKVSLTRSDVVSVQLKGNNSEVICGTSHFIYAGEGAPRMDYSSAEGVQVTLVCKDGDDPAAFPAGDYFMVIWPKAFTAGYRLILTLEDGSKTMLNTSASVTYERNGGANLGEIDNKSTWCPSTIMTAAQLKMWRRLAEAGAYGEGDEVKLGADINLGGYAWTPVSEFLGIFDGQNHKIYNFTVEDASSNRLGFISTLGSSKGVAAVLKNTVFGSSNGTTADGSSSITMTKSSSDAWLYAGIVGYAHLNSTIQNVTNFVPVSVSSAVTTKHAFGGIVGMTNENVTLENCVNRAPVTDNSACETTDDSAIGGVVGWNDSKGLTVSGCENYGVLTNNCVGVSCIGGIMGKATCQSFRMEECSNHANVTNAAASVTSGTNNWDKAVAVGGVLGRFGKNNNTNNYIDKCSNEGQICLGAETVEVHRQAYGGVIGTIIYKCTVRGCSNTGKVYDNAVVNSDLSMGGILGAGTSSNLVLTQAEDGTPNTNSGEIFHYKKHNHETWFGGIVGYMTSSGTVEYSINNGRLVSDPSGQNVKKDFNAGGICGNSKGSILNCTNNGYIFTWAGNLTTYIGGICGGYSSSYKPTRVLNCTNNGYLGPYNTTGSSITGGILARFYPSDTEVRGCTSTGLITSGDFYSGGSGNTPSSTVTSYQKKDYYMAGLFGRVEAPTSDVTDNVTDCVVACTISNKTNADDCSNWTALIAGKTFSTSSTTYKLVFGTASNPILIVNNCRIEFADVPASSETITTTALAKKWLMGASSSLYDPTNGTSDASKVDFNFVLSTPAVSGIE